MLQKTQKHVVRVQAACLSIAEKSFNPPQDMVGDFVKTTAQPVDIAHHRSVRGQQHSRLWHGGGALCRKCCSVWQLMVRGQRVPEPLGAVGCWDWLVGAQTASTGQDWKRTTRGCVQVQTCTPTPVNAFSPSCDYFTDFSGSSSGLTLTAGNDAGYGWQ